MLKIRVTPTVTEQVMKQQEEEAKAEKALKAKVPKPAHVWHRLQTCSCHAFPHL